MFESNFVEFFSHVHPVTPLVIYVPLMGYMIYISVVNYGLDALAILGLFVFGVLVWTFLEYMLHRFVFHYQPKSTWGKRFHFILHGVHHDYPNDATRLVMPPGISIPLAVIFYAIFLAVFGAALTPAIFTGMIFGYLCYDMLHYATHHFSMKKGVWAWLKKHHMRHHYGDDHTGYGVSTPLWDFVFGTYKAPEKRS
jgi:sterol desaturase/sphingolipid hydroxylase (fatty acid hydroxylase superfamily)